MKKNPVGPQPENAKIILADAGQKGAENDRDGGGARHHTQPSKEILPRAHVPERSDVDRQH